MVDVVGCRLFLFEKREYICVPNSVSYFYFVPNMVSMNNLTVCFDARLGFFWNGNINNIQNEINRIIQEVA